MFGLALLEKPPPEAEVDELPVVDELVATDEAAKSAAAVLGIDPTLLDDVLWDQKNDEIALRLSPPSLVAIAAVAALCDDSPTKRFGQERVGPEVLALYASLVAGWLSAYEGASYEECRARLRSALHEEDLIGSPRR